MLIVKMCLVYLVTETMACLVTDALIIAKPMSPLSEYDKKEDKLMLRFGKRGNADVAVLRPARRTVNSRNALSMFTHDRIDPALRFGKRVVLINYVDNPAVMGGGRTPLSKLRSVKYKGSPEFLLRFGRQIRQ